MTRKMVAVSLGERWRNLPVYGLIVGVTVTMGTLLSTYILYPQTTSPTPQILPPSWVYGVPLLGGVLVLASLVALWRQPE